MKVGDKVEYLRKSQMFPYDVGTVMFVNHTDYSGDTRIGVDFRPLHKAEVFWVWKGELRVLTKLEKALKWKKLERAIWFSSGKLQLMSGTQINWSAPCKTIKIQST